MEGYIKLYRKMLENPVICKDSDHIAVWVYLLLNATHKDMSALFKGEKITLNPGQLITGRKSIAMNIKISESKVQRILKLFENEHMIEQQTSNANRLISILNWKEYQQSEQQNEQPVNNQRTTSEQRVNTNKNDKNVKNDKNNNRDIYIGIISNFTADENLKKTIMDFIEMRQQKKKPPTERALNIILKKASEISSDIQTQIKIFEQSIVNGWTDIYPLKNQRQDKPYKPLGNIFLREDV